MTAKWLLSCVLLTSVAYGQDTALDVSGEVQYSWISGRKQDSQKVQGDAGHGLLRLDKGPWELTGSYFFYPLCDFNEFGETTLAYRSPSGVAVRAGRFVPKISQSTWYDQWNSGFVFLPDVEYWTYFDELSLWRTTPGAEVTIPLANSSLTLTAMDDDCYDHNYLVPRRFNRQSARFETLVGKVVLGAAAYQNAAHFKDGQHLEAADFRTSGNHWVLRGQAMIANKYDVYYRGFFTDLAVRPPGQDKLTLLARYETSRFEFMNHIYREYGLTLGGKYTLPKQWVLSVNFITGSFTPQMNFERGWVFGLQKTIAF